MRMKEFTNLPIKPIADMLGLELTGRKGVINKKDCADIRYLSAQIHLYLCLHFYANSNSGITGLLSVSALANQLSCHEKTLRRSLLTLNDAGLISILESPESGYVNVQIQNLSDMYKRRGEGGKGFFIGNQDLLQELLRIKKINVLRAVLTALIETVNAVANSASKIFGGIQLSMRTLKASFPTSARPSDIRSACQGDGSFGVLFSRVAPDLKKTITVKLQNRFNAAQIKQNLRSQAKRMIFDEVEQINELLRKANTDIFEDQRIHCDSAAALYRHHIDLWSELEPTHQEKNLPLLDFTSAEKNDLVVIAQDYGIDTVLDAIHLYYLRYKLSSMINFSKDKTKSIGGMIRKIVSELCQTPVSE